MAKEKDIPPEVKALMDKYNAKFDALDLTDKEKYILKELSDHMLKMIIATILAYKWPSVEYSTRAIKLAVDYVKESIDNSVAAVKK